MHNPECELEYMTLEILWDFEVLTDHIISDRRPDLVIVKKSNKKHWIVEFALPPDQRVKLKEIKYIYK